MFVLQGDPEIELGVMLLLPNAKRPLVRLRVVNVKDEIPEPKLTVLAAGVFKVTPDRENIPDVPVIVVVTAFVSEDGREEPSKV